MRVHGGGASQRSHLKGGERKKGSDSACSSCGARGSACLPTPHTPPPPCPHTHPLTWGMRARRQPAHEVELHRRAAGVDRPYVLFQELASQ
jgi:hypothetical protein